MQRFSIPRLFRLSEHALSGPRVVRMLSSVLPEMPDTAGKQTWVTLTKTGTFTDPRYGTFAITLDMLHNMVQQFNAHAVGTDIFLDVSHEPDKGAAATIIKLSVEGKRLRALVEWTKYGLEAVKNRGFKYLSAEYHENWVGNEVGVNDYPHGAVLLGAGLTVRPVIKGNDPITLSSDSDGTKILFVHPDLAHILLTEVKNTMNILEKLLASIGASALSEAAKTEFKNLAQAQLKDVTDEAQAKALAATIEASMNAAVKALAEQPAQMPAPTTPATITAPVPAATEPHTLSETQVADIVSKQLAQAKQAEAKQASDLQTKQKLLSDTIAAAQGLDDELKKELSGNSVGLITAQTSDEQVKNLAQMQINQGHQIMAARQLSSMGYPGAAPQGSPHIVVVNDDAKTLAQIYMDNLGKSNSARLLHLDPKATLPPFCQRILAEFDRQNAPRLAHERKTLAGGTGTMDTSNATLPMGFVREVLRQSLSDLRILELVQNLTDFGAQATTQIPFELRDTSQIVNMAMVAEGKPIPFAGVTQGMELAYINQMKLAMSITNEVIHFTRASMINWDAMGRNIESNARVLRELIALRIANEIQRATDSFGALAVVAESFSAQLTGAKSVVKTTYFPVVAPYQPRDLQGNAVGTAENLMTVTLNSTVIQPYDGSNKQASGTYYKVNSYNTGLIQFVNQLGVAVTPANTGTNTISYSRATNVALWDSDPASGVKYEDHLNSLLRAIGKAKAMMKSQRYSSPDYALMSSSLNDEVSNATQFITSLKRDGSDTTGGGDLGMVKGIPVFTTDVPGAVLGDDRIIFGQRGVTSYTVAKPYALGEMIELIDPTTGAPIGKKVAYGEEYNSIYTPKAVRDRATSIVKYSSSARAAI